MIKEKILWVKEQLTLDPTLRDSNEKLYFKYLKHIGYNTTISVKDFLKDMEKRKIPYIDAIARASRKVQEENIELRGLTYGKRQKKSLEVIEEIRALSGK